MKTTWLITTFSLLLLTGSAFGQNDKYIKLDLFRATVPSLGLSYESRNEKSGWEIEVIYDARPSTIYKVPDNCDFLDPCYFNDREGFEFSNIDLDLVLSYKRYFGLFKKPDRAYIGVFNRNQFHLHRDDAYYIKWIEVHSTELSQLKTFRKLIIGPTAGVSFPIGKKIRIEAGLGIGVDLISTFSKDGNVSYDAHLPILIGYKF